MTQDLTESHFGALDFHLDSVFPMRSDMSRLEQEYYYKMTRADKNLTFVLRSIDYRIAISTVSHVVPYELSVFGSDAR